MLILVFYSVYLWTAKREKKKRKRKDKIKSDRKGSIQKIVNIDLYINYQRKNGQSTSVVLI